MRCTATFRHEGLRLVWALFGPCLGEGYLDITPEFPRIAQAGSNISLLFTFNGVKRFPLWKLFWGENGVFLKLTEQLRGNIHMETKKIVASKNAPSISRRSTGAAYLKRSGQLVFCSPAPSRNVTDERCVTVRGRGVIPSQQPK